MCARLGAGSLVSTTCSLQSLPVELDTLHMCVANVDCLVAASMVAFSWRSLAR